MTETWQIVRIEPLARQIDCIVVADDEVFKGTEVVQKDVIFEKYTELPEGTNGFQLWNAEFSGREGHGVSIYFNEKGWQKTAGAAVGQMIGSLESVKKSEVVMEGGRAEEQLQAIAKSYIQKDGKLTSAKAFLKACMDNPALATQYDKEYRDAQKRMAARRFEEALK